MNMPNPRPGLRAARRRRGLTIIEVMVVLLILTVGVGMLAQTLAALGRIGTVNWETAISMQAGRNTIETIRGEDFFEVFARFNADAADDPAAGDSPGNFFAVTGLNLRVDDPDGFVGEVIFPVIDGELREDFVDAGLGMPRDLNGDGIIDGLDHSADYVILPVRVQIAWTGKTGDRTINLDTALTDI